MSEELDGKVLLGQSCGEASADAEVFAGLGSEPAAAEGELWTAEQWLANALRWAFFQVGTDPEACAANILRRADDCGLALTRKWLIVGDDGVPRPVQPPITKGAGSAASGDTRNLVSRFFQLKLSEKREIAQMFGLLLPEEWSLPERERWKAALVEARRRGLLGQVADSVTLYLEAASPAARSDLARETPNPQGQTQ